MKLIREYDSMMWHGVKIVLFSALFLCMSRVDKSDAKVFTPCGLITELRRLNVDRSYIGNWLCMIRSESFLNTSLVVDKGSNRKTLGLFQLDNSVYCKNNKAGGDCRIKCADLLDDDISDDYKCAKNLGWATWPGWVRNCKGSQTATALPTC